MKKFVCILVAAFFMAANGYGQGDVTITWLTSETRANAFGTNSAQGGTYGGFMEFDQEDILFNNGKQIDSIKQIIFHIYDAAYPSVTACNVVILQGSSISTATEVVNQTVSLSNLQSNWNTVTLTNPYKVDSTKRLYIGYKATVSGAAYPVSVSAGTEPKQAWLYQSTASTPYTNIVPSYQYSMMVKALASTKASPANEISLVALNIKDYVLLGDSVQIRGTVKNLGSATLNSFTVSYEIDGQIIDTETINGLNVNAGNSQLFAMTKYYVPTVAKVSSAIKVTISNPNGTPDLEDNNTQTTECKLKVYNTTTNRIVLHESFTSSTCTPCKAGNEVFKSVLATKPYDDWTCVKYQMSWPNMGAGNSGDPYYTAEGGVRRTFYAINSVPHLIAEGIGYAGNSGSYTSSIYNTLKAIPSGVTFTDGTSTMVEQDLKTISLDATIVPAIDLTTNSDLRFFAAVIEKRTVNNKKTNGETEFEYVFKKFMTSANGDNIAGLTLGAEVPVKYTYTFNGNYRLPADATNPINNNTEHSVEIFKNLMVVYWLQDMNTKEVYQSGKAEPYPGVIVSLKDINNQDVTLSVFPNPATDKLHIKSNISFAKISLVNLLGQTIREINVGNENYTMDVSDVAKGLYLLKIDTEQGSVTKKIQIK